MQSTMMQKPLANKAAQPLRPRAGAKPVASARAFARASRRSVVPFAAATAAPVAASKDLDMKCINAIRFLAIDAVNKANSGHPGLPMGCAPMTYVLFNEIMNFNPKNTKFFNRDRFVLSAGHGSMLQYAMLHLCGYDSVSMDDIKQFRQWNSATPGHPENFVTPGVEVTTGPLGQGICNGVGLAVAEANLAARFNKPDAKIVDHYTYVIMGDGCNMEGISTEACSLAGHWGLGKLIVLWDDNKISIDGHTDIAFTEDVSARFASLGWHTLHVQDGNTDLDALRSAIAEAKSVTDKPTMIKVSTLIGYGSPNKANSYAAHGAPLGADETTLTREALGWPYAPFEVPAEVYGNMQTKLISKGSALEEAWNAASKSYAAKYPAEYAEFKAISDGVLPAGWEASLPSFTSEDKALATRQHSQTMLNALAPALPGLIGGSADLASSNLTLMKMFGDFQKSSPAERNVRFGVREHAMGAICNGIGLHSPGFIPYCATFFIFTDYMRGAMRMSALSEVGVIYVMTHDSIGLGEDGPTHQPIEHLASFRAMPNMLMFRPAGGNETAGAYKVAVANRKRPSTIALSRQNIDNLPGCTVDDVAKGAYIVTDTEGTPDVIIIGTGSELPMASDAVKALTAEGIKARLVSMPCWELFQDQTEEYRNSVLPPSVTARVSVEAGSSFGWREWIGTHGIHIGIDGFGASAPAPLLFEKFGITLPAVIAAAKKVAGK